MKKKTKGDSLGDRMKGYESVTKTRLVRRMPVIIRIDGKAFHTFTKGFEKPFDQLMMNAMQKTTKKLCENIQNCVFGYTQSDEITLVLVDYKKVNTCPWFDNEVQKICSVAASMATLWFNHFFLEEYMLHIMTLGITYGESMETEAYAKALEKGAMFDARCFNVPINDVVNNLIWRQQDATRNSIEATGRANFSHKQLHKKNCNMIQEMLYKEKGINWNDLPIPCKRGTAILKDDEGKWYVDEAMPILTENRDYLEKLINFE